MYNKFEKEPDLKLTDVDIAKEAEIFSKDYKGGIIKISKEESDGLQKIRIIEYHPSEINRNAFPNLFNSFTKI